MRKQALLSVVLAAAASLAFAAAAAAWLEEDIIVEPGGQNRFDPEQSKARIPDARFAWHWGPTVQDHNVRQDRRLFYSGPPTTDDTFSISVSAGTYHYYCEPHGSESGGMEGTVKAKMTSDPPAADGSFRVTWAVNAKTAQAERARRGSQGPTETGDRFDVRFKVGSGDWRTWKNDTSKVRARFGRNDNPVRIRSGKEYKFKARSQKGPNDSRVSGWSPKLTVET